MNEPEEQAISHHTGKPDGSVSGGSDAYDPLGPDEMGWGTSARGGYAGQVMADQAKLKAFEHGMEIAKDPDELNRFLKEEVEPHKYDMPESEYRGIYFLLKTTKDILESFPDAEKIPQDEMVRLIGKYT